MNKTMLIAFTAALTLTATLEVSAQIRSARGGVANDWRHHVGMTVSPQPADADDEIGAKVPTIGGETNCPDQTKTIGTAIFSSAGSFAGMYAGAWIGYSTGPYDESIGGLIVGAAVGSAVGAALGSTALTGDVQRSVLGSLAGGVGGLFAGMAISGAMNNDWAGWVTYSAVHGIVTAVVANQ